MIRHRALNAGKGINLGLRDHLAQGLLDEITPGQAKGVRLCQILLDGQIFLR